MHIELKHFKEMNSNVHVGKLNFHSWIANVYNNIIYISVVNKHFLSAICRNGY